MGRLRVEGDRSANRMTTLGIDLGTTNSLVAVFRPEGPETLANELGEHLTPSAVAHAEDGALLVGRAARDRLAVAPGSGRAFFKRDMGRSDRYPFGDGTWTPTACSAVVLRELLRVARLSLGEPVSQAVVSVPAYFRDPERRATLEAARLAGLEVLHLVNEPTAAALAYGYRAEGGEKRVLVLDLGGGTFDVTLLEMFEGILEVKASAGDSHLGGEDYTDVLLRLVTDRLARPPDDAGRGRLRQRVEVAKRHLSQRSDAEVAWDVETVRVTREEFERAAAPLTARLMPLVRRALADAGTSADDVDDVLLVGGATRMPLVTSLVTDAFGRMPNRSLDPDRVVALGAAVQAARAAKHDAVADVVMTDVCPHSLGIAVSRDVGSRTDDGLFAPILDRNVTVPVSRVETFYTRSPEQDGVKLEVYQGESRRVEENTLLGTLEVDGLRWRPGQKNPGALDVRFTYDASGILEVEATVLHSGKRRSKVLEGRPGALTPAQVKAVLARLAPLKVRQRDLLPHRARLERAHRLYVDLVGERRRALAQAIDAYEDALEGDRPEAIAPAAALVDQWIRQAYRDEGEEGPRTPEVTDAPEPTQPAEPEGAP